MVSVKEGQGKQLQLASNKEYLWKIILKFMTKQDEKFYQEINTLLEENEKKIAIMELPVCEQCGKSFDTNGEKGMIICFECE